MTVIDVTLRDFTIDPRTINTRAGRVTFRVSNRGMIEHDFHIPTAERHASHQAHLLKPGETKTFEYDLTPGQYDVLCTIPGHKEAGMRATLTVTP